MRGARDYIFKLLLSAVGQPTKLFSDMIWPSLSKVPPPLSKEGTKARMATCKRKMFMHKVKRKRNKHLLKMEKVVFFPKTMEYDHLLISNF